MMRAFYRALGTLSLLLGAVGAVLPLLPTVPFLLLAAFCFARSNPAMEQRLLAHPRWGPHILAWRRERAISRRGKIAAALCFAASAAAGLLMLDGVAAFAPLAVGIVAGSWILSRPEPSGRS